MPGYTPEMLGLKTAKAWGLTPAQWRALEVDDRASMLALDLFDGTVESYRTQYASDHHDRRQRSEDASGVNEFTLMKREMGLL